MQKVPQCGHFLLYSDCMEKPHIYVDIRRPEEYAEGHIPGAPNISFEDENSFIETVRNLVDVYVVTLYCQSSFRSSYAQALLAAKHGLSVGNLEGGLSLYQGPLEY